MMPDDGTVLATAIVHDEVRALDDQVAETNAAAAEAHAEDVANLDGHIAADMAAHISLGEQIDRLTTRMAELEAQLEEARTVTEETPTEAVEEAPAAQEVAVEEPAAIETPSLIPPEVIDEHQEERRGLWIRHPMHRMSRR